MKIDIFTFAHNEELTLPITVAFYRKKFRDCNIIVYDNESTDNTVALARQLGCEVRPFITHGTYDDKALANLKNTCWKSSNADWVIVCDMDELVDVREEDLRDTNATIITTIMCNVISLIHGRFYPNNKDKIRLFKRCAIREINWEVGCHNEHIVPNEGFEVIKSGGFTCYHIKWLSFQYVVERHKAFAKRLSAQNIRNRWSYHWRWTTRQHKREYNEIISKASNINLITTLMSV
ncbi:glycosyltransferase family 2 protein [Foetidibacter luteolus]|uniref:glycosyltransferase family 2 protein n=1 Tax=Foetidibacter luteolus TaxID=2608880 RepID=UPI001A98BB14|nr:glycosyltransferase family 2 protein [Foetidibacter luteolus]